MVDADRPLAIRPARWARIARMSPRGKPPPVHDQKVLYALVRGLAQIVIQERHHFRLRRQWRRDSALSDSPFRSELLILPDVIQGSLKSIIVQYLASTSSQGVPLKQKARPRPNDSTTLLPPKLGNVVEYFRLRTSVVTRQRQTSGDGRTQSRRISLRWPGRRK